MPVFRRFSLIYTLFKCACRGRSKLGNGKFHLAEKTAGVGPVLTGGALLFGNGAGSSVNKQLRRALQTDNGKDAERNKKHTSLPTAAKSTGKSTADRLGDLAAAASAVAAASNLRNANGKNNRINSLYHCGGSIVTAIGIIAVSFTAEAIAGGAEDMNVSFAAEKHNALIKDGDTVEFAAVASANTAFKD